MPSQKSAAYFRFFIILAFLVLFSKIFVIILMDPNPIIALPCLVSPWLIHSSRSIVKNWYNDFSKFYIFFLQNWYMDFLNFLHGFDKDFEFCWWFYKQNQTKIWYRFWSSLKGLKSSKSLKSNALGPLGFWQCSFILSYFHDFLWVSHFFLKDLYFLDFFSLEGFFVFSWSFTLQKTLLVFSWSVLF